jgi:hypothetical protein
MRECCCQVLYPTKCSRHIQQLTGNLSSNALLQQGLALQRLCGRSCCCHALAALFLAELRVTTPVVAVAGGAGFEGVTAALAVSDTVLGAGVAPAAAALAARYRCFSASASAKSANIFAGSKSSHAECMTLLRLLATQTAELTLKPLPNPSCHTRSPARTPLKLSM